MKKRVQIIGNYLNELNSVLKEHDIICENVIDACSPFAMAGKSEQCYLEHCEDQNTPMLTFLNIKKNLSQLLSHDEKNFCSNLNLQPIGKEVRKKNSSEYIIVMNSFAVCPLYEKNGVVYSELWEETEFIKSIRKDKSFKKRTFPFADDFNWKFYYDFFIDAIKREYDRKHIIFIKCNCSQWYMDGQNICHFDAARSSRYRNMITKIDDYFIEKTHCIVIDEQFNHIPPKSDPNRQFPYILMSKNTASEIGKKIAEIINCGAVFDNNFPSIPRNSSELYERLLRKLSSDSIKENRDSILKIERDWLLADDLRSPEYEGNRFFTELLKLEPFLNGERDYNLSDYVLENISALKSGEAEVDIDLVETYTKLFRLDINDVIAVYTLSICSSQRKGNFRNIAANFLNNSDFLPLNSSEELFNINAAYLKKYPYLNVELPSSRDPNKAYINLENNSILIINPESKNPFIKIDNLIKDDFDYTAIVNNGYFCPIEYADALTYSYEFYAEKARNGDGAKPTYLKFESIEHFFNTLNYINYEELLSNENFVFYFQDTDALVPEAYTPNVDFTLFMDPDTVIVRVQNGLADQICHYMLGQAIASLTERRVIYYDLSCIDFNGCELRKFAKNEIELFSDKISKRLSLIGTDPSMQHVKKINDYTLVTDNGYFESMFKKIWWETAGYFCRDLKKYLNTRLPYSYYYRLIGINNLLSVFPCRLSDYVEFPPFEKEEHKKLSSEMLSSDAVVIHVRRGDLVSIGWDTDGEYYIEAIQRLMGFTQYKNKKFFVFSDDIPWCKEHRSKIGLDLIEGFEIHFVEGNSFDESFRDIQMMSLGKIMIIGDSNFSRTAAINNDRCEIMYCGNKKFFDTYQQNIRENKYNENVYPFSKDYSRPYVYMKPKKQS